MTRGSVNHYTTLNLDASSIPSAANFFSLSPIDFSSFLARGICDRGMREFSLWSRSIFRRLGRTNLRASSRLRLRMRHVHAVDRVRIRIPHDDLGRDALERTRKELTQSFGTRF